MKIKDKKIPPTAESIQLVADAILKGGLVVFPWGKLERKCLAFMCDSSNIEACQRMNLIKKRSGNQVLAINGYPELIVDVAKIENSKPLQFAAKHLGITPQEVLERCMKTGAISFIFEARENLPSIVTNRINGIKTVMIAGELDESDFDFYTELVKHLHKRKIITAGSSANRTTSGTYYLFEQEKAYEDLKEDIDLFVYHSPLPKKPLQALNLESCTTFDMTVHSDIPQIKRFGSVNPKRFLKIFKGFSVSKDVVYLSRHEKTYHRWIKLPLQAIDRLRG